MTITPADVLQWTNVTVSRTQLDAFAPAAETALDADGGAAITGISRTQLLSYLIAGYATTAAGGAGRQAETIGDYSYTRQTSAGSSIWVDLYRETLKALIAAAGRVPGITALTDSPLVERVDTDIMRMNRQFPASSGRLI